MLKGHVTQYIGVYFGVSYLWKSKSQGPLVGRSHNKDHIACLGSCWDSVLMEPSQIRANLRVLESCSGGHQKHLAVSINWWLLLVPVLKIKSPTI